MPAPLRALKWSRAAITANAARGKQRSIKPFPLMVLRANAVMLETAARPPHPAARTCFRRTSADPARPTSSRPPPIVAESAARTLAARAVRPALSYTVALSGNRTALASFAQLSSTLRRLRRAAHLIPSEQPHQLALNTHPVGRQDAD